MTNPLDLNKIKQGENTDDLLTDLLNLIDDMTSVIDSDTMVGAEEYKERLKAVVREYEL